MYPATRVESRTGALTVGSGGYSVTFASGLSPAPLSRFQSPLSEPDVRFSRISALQWDHASRTQVPARIVDDSMVVPYSIHALPAARPMDALTRRLLHVMPPVSGPLPGQAFATPGTLPPSVTAPHLRPLPSTGITRLLQYYEPLRHPAGPASPSRGPGSVHASPPTGLPMLLPPSPSSVPAPLPRRIPRGARVARFPLRLRPSPFLRWVGFRIARFEACSTFTRVPARMFAEPLKAAL